MDKFPRDKQNVLLLKLYELLPNHISRQEFSELVELFGSEDNFVINVWYLQQHGLIGNAVTFGIDGHSSINLSGLKITRDGIDFIRDDGGLTSVLNIMTIKVHNETIEKIEEIIKQSSLSEADKKSYVDKLRELPADTTKHVVLKLIDLGLSRVPDVIQLIASSIHS